MAQSKFLNEKLRQTLIDKVREGCFETTACDFVGINHTTYWAWLKRGREESDDEKSEYAKFARQIAKAKAEAEFHLVDRVKTAADTGTWLAAKWLLEKTRPDKFADVEWRKSKLNEKTDFAVDLGKPSVGPEGSAGDNPQS